MEDGGIDQRYRSPLATLGLGGDGDELSLLLAVERAFGVNLSDDEISSCFTVGDLFDLLNREMPPDLRAGKCASAMAFYRLRRVLVAQAPRTEILPSAHLADLVRMPAYRFHAELEKRSGLNVPAFAFGAAGNTGLLSILGGATAFLGSLLFAVPVWIAALAFVAGVGLMLADQRVLPDTTIGEFARDLSALNFAAFAREGARSTEASLWDAYVKVLREETGEVGPIARETRILA